MPFWYLIEHLDLDMRFSTSNAHHLIKRDYWAESFTRKCS